MHKSTPTGEESFADKGSSGPLAGVRILDIATVLAGPFASTLCSDLGASVVKLELPDGSDALRRLAPVKPPHALFWKVTNRGKKGITLDIRKEEGRQIFLRLIREFDVLVENFRTGTMDRWGLDIETLRKSNPNLIVMRLTGFGQTGPYADRPGFARIFEAMSGFANLTGENGGGPLHMNYPLGDAIAGLFGAFSIVTAIAERKLKPGCPAREIDLAATEAMIRLLEPLAAEYEQLGKVRTRSGSLATYTAPSNMYKAKDGCWITLVASSEPIFRRLCEAMHQADMVKDERFSTNLSRTKHVNEIDAIVGAWVSAHSYDEVSVALSAFGVPFSKVYTIEDVLEDEHFNARQTIIRIRDPELGSLPAPCVVPRFSGYEPEAPRSGPGVGEHNDEIYGSIGIDGPTLKELMRANVI